MTLPLVALGVLSAWEIVLWLPLFRRWRRSLVIGLIPPLAVATGLLFGARPAVWTGGVVFFGIYRLLNLLRIVEGRPDNTEFLAVSAARSSLLLIGLQLLSCGLGVVASQYKVGWLVWLYCLLVTQSIAAIVLLSSTQRHVRTTEPPPLGHTMASRDLPTVTAAIPARNETDDLEACLQSLVASDYPKLEILVLDDCSQEKRTPEIIRTFAHDGVRFLSGKIPSKRWLAKNYAYKQLAGEANGELLLFCGVDVRFAPQTLTVLVQTLLQKHKQMISLAPDNQLPSQKRVRSWLLQPSRYAWEIALPRRWLQRPPVLSTCWLIYRSRLKQYGGFEAVSHSISPESYFARQAARDEDGYSFMHGNQQLGLGCVKSVNEQQATTVRTRYPQLHRRPELVSLLSLAEFCWLMLPFGMLPAATQRGAWIIALWSGLNVVLLLVFYGKMVTFTYRRGLLSALLLPIAALYDSALLNYSMWQYEFNEVVWKGRNICIPVMHAVSAPPKN